MRNGFRLGVFLLSFCVSASAFALDWEKKEREVSDFSAIRSQYINDIEVIGGGAKNKVILSGNPHLFNYVKTTVDNGILNIKAPRGVHVLIQAANLNSLEIVGEGHLEGKGLDVLGPLSIALAGSVEVTLFGPVDLARVVTSGKTSLSAHWVDAQDMHIYTSEKSHVTLNGRAAQSHLGVYNDSQVDARWLRAKEMEVQTSGRAQAKVLPVEGLTAYAADTSRVEYYKRPLRFTPFSGKYGNVLRVGDVE